jgi:hypothetical protein
VTLFFWIELAGLLDVVVVVSFVWLSFSNVGEGVVVVVLLCVMFGVVFSACLRFFVLKMLSLCW